MTEPIRTMESDFRKRVFYARLATGIGYIMGLAVAAMSIRFGLRESRFTMLTIAGVFAVSGRFWAAKFYRCSRCDARIMPDRGPFFGAVPTRCPKCQQKLASEP